MRSSGNEDCSENWLNAPDEATSVSKGRSHTDQLSLALATPPDISGAAVLDFERLCEFTEGDGKMEYRLIEMFMRVLNNDVSSLAACLNADTFERWLAIVHKLGGATAHMGANALAMACTIAETSELTEPNTAESCHQLILSEYQRLCHLLHDRMAALSDGTSTA